MALNCFHPRCRGRYVRQMTVAAVEYITLRSVDSVQRRVRQLLARSLAYAFLGS